MPGLAPCSWVLRAWRRRRRVRFRSGTRRWGGAGAATRSLCCSRRWTRWRGWWRRTSTRCSSGARTSTPSWTRRPTSRRTWVAPVPADVSCRPTAGRLGREADQSSARTSNKISARIAELFFETRASTHKSIVKTVRLKPTQYKKPQPLCGAYYNSFNIISPCIVSAPSGIASARICGSNERVAIQRPRAPEELHETPFSFWTPGPFQLFHRVLLLVLLDQYNINGVSRIVLPRKEPNCRRKTQLHV